MKKSCLVFLVSFVALAASLHAGAKLQSREESLVVFDQHHLTIAVPPGFTYQANHGEGGVAQVKLEDETDHVSMDIVFLPDPEEQYKNLRARCELLNDEFSEFVETSSEKAMQFEELVPRAGSGTFCVFTDAKLAGKNELPPGEYIQLTAGLKAWPGVVAIFRLFSNDTKSAVYQAAMKMLRDSVQEKLSPER